jgi:hypothetical protein
MSLHGVRNTVGDIAHDVRDWLYRPVKQEPAKVPVADWVTVLYHGSVTTGETQAGAAVAQALAAIDQERTPEREIIFETHGPSFDGAKDEHPAEIVEPDAESDDVSVIAGALAEHLRLLGPGRSLLLRMTDDGLEIGERRSRTSAGTTPKIEEEA